MDSIMNMLVAVRHSLFAIGNRLFDTRYSVTGNRVTWLLHLFYNFTANFLIFANFCKLFFETVPSNAFYAQVKRQQL